MCTGRPDTSPNNGFECVNLFKTCNRYILKKDESIVNRYPKPESDILLDTGKLILFKLHQGNTAENI